MKNYLIIGGSTGIGLALTNLLATEHNVFATYSKNEKQSIGNVQYFPLNVMDENYDFGVLPDVIDGIVYCPGSINLKPFSRIKPEDFITDYQLQVIGAVRVIQQIFNKLKQGENPSIVLFSTVAVQIGFNFHSLVASSKGAVEGLTKALAAEFAPKVRVNCIAPSITDTPLAGNLLNTPEKKEANGQRHPMKRVGEADDIAQVAAFLLSEKASWITGQIFHVDGGMSALKI